MIGIERTAFLAAIVLLLFFLANLLSGAFASVGFLHDVGEALLLFGGCILFVIGVLHRERREKINTNADN